MANLNFGFWSGFFFMIMDTFIISATLFLCFLFLSLFSFFQTSRGVCLFLTSHFGFLRFMEVFKYFRSALLEMGHAEFMYKEGQL